MKVLSDCGISVSESVADIGRIMKSLMIKTMRLGLKMNNITFAIIKPDAVKNRNTGKIYDRIISTGFEIKSAKLLRMTQSQAESFTQYTRKTVFW